MIWLTFILLIYVLQIGLVLLLEHRHASRAAAWLLVVIALPIAGFVFYMLAAKEYRQRLKLYRQGRKRLRRLPAPVRKKIHVARKARELKNRGIRHQHRLVGVLQSMPEAPITDCNEVKVYADAADKYEDLLEAIKKARHHIHLEYYIVRPDEIGRKLQQALIDKAREGVEVRFMYDGVGSYALPSAYGNELEKAGVQVRCFLPPLVSLASRRINYRNHRKIVVIDGIVGFAGGMNIGDEHLGRHPRLGFWRDTHLRLEGDAVYFLQHVFMRDWQFGGGDKVEGNRYYPDHDCRGREQVQMIAGGPDSDWDSILELYFTAISTAENRVWIATPYFVPDGSIRMALKTAALGGVDVRLLLPGVFDHKLVSWASLSYARELLESGVKLYQFSKGFLHSKVMIVDRTIASVGTANMDMRSFFYNFELNAVLFDETSISRLAAQFELDVEDSKRLGEHNLSRRPLGEALARLLSPLL